MLSVAGFALLDGGYLSANPHAQYDVTADDQRFVTIRNRGVEELKAKVGN